MSEQFDFGVLTRDLDITKSRVFRRDDAAFFGPLLCGLDFSWDTSIQTAATDGENLAWSPHDFVRCRDQNQGEDVSTLMHELWHVARLHDLRRGLRCPDIWNDACDIWINRQLIKAKYYIGPDWLVRPDLDHIEVEEDIYDALPKSGGGGSSGGTVPGSGGGHGHCNHAAMAGKTNIQATIANVVKATQSAKMAGQPGSIPGNTEQILEKFLAPIIKWEQHLYQWMSELANEDFTWARPNRRHSEIYLPSRFEDEGRLAHLMYFQDVSGSITDRNIMRFNSELKYVWDVFQPKRMTVAQFDTRITKVDEFTEGDPYEKIKIVGRGGTDLRPVRELIIEMKPTAAIIFSDMQVAPMQKLPVEVPILWVGVDAAHVKPPFGKIIHIKE
jgi:predicted metal-dependent peptidase